MSVKFMKFITRDYVRNNRDKFFVFGDNERRIGRGGQAREMRGEPNSIGIRTKRLPSNEPDAFWYDTYYPMCVKMVEDDFRMVEAYLRQGYMVVFPSGGIGTGLANLKQNAPSILAYIDNRIKGLCEKYGVVE